MNGGGDTPSKTPNLLFKRQLEGQTRAVVVDAEGKVFAFGGDGEGIRDSLFCTAVGDDFFISDVAEADAVITPCVDAWGMNYYPDGGEYVGGNGGTMITPETPTKSSMTYTIEGWGENRVNPSINEWSD